MNLIPIIIILWIGIAFVSMMAGKKTGSNSGGRSTTGGHPAQIGQINQRKDVVAGGRRGRNTESKPLRNTIPEPGTIADWVNRSGMMGTQTSLSALEDRENDWLAQEIRREAAADNEFISEMKKLKLEHKRVHNKIHGN